MSASETRDEVSWRQIADLPNLHERFRDHTNVGAGAALTEARIVRWIVRRFAAKLGVQQVAERLDDRFATLTEGRREAGQDGDEGKPANDLAARDNAAIVRRWIQVAITDR